MESKKKMAKGKLSYRNPKFRFFEIRPVKFVRKHLRALSQALWRKTKTKESRGK